MISEIFVRSTQNSQTLPCVTLTKGLGYLWDHVCCPHTPQTPMEGVKNPTMAKIEYVLTISGILQHKYYVFMGLVFI